jgi:uroporphyrinogen decarboxylase
MGVYNMNSREKVLSIFERKNSNEAAFWTGHPNDLTVPIYSKEWGIEPTREAIYQYLNDDCRWFSADGGYHHPEGLPALDPSYGIDRSRSLGAKGCFANAETVAEIEAYPWPNPDYCEFSEIYDEIDKYQDKMIFTGMWSSFFHIVADFFGMENYFINMYENPKVIEAATEKIVDYYVASNERFFAGLGDRADTMFFGNDFGTQLDLFVSPESFRKFILPSFKRLIAVGKKYKKKIMLHSCGSIYRIIPDLIAAGVDVLHPIQAQAVGMSAKDLAKYKNDLAFVGGIDAQRFIVDATPQQVADEVKRVREILGRNIVISPSHEEILPNVPAGNMLAMSRAARVF